MPTETTVECPGCHIPYPVHLLSRLIGDEDKREVCPICALERINQVHHTNRTSFAYGSLSESNRREAVRWRKKVGRG